MRCHAITRLAVVFITGVFVWTLSGHAELIISPTTGDIFPIKEVVTLRASVKNPTLPSQNCCKKGGGDGGKWTAGDPKLTWTGKTNGDQLDVATAGDKPVTCTAKIPWQCEDGTTAETTEEAVASYCVVDPGKYTQSVKAINYIEKWQLPNQTTSYGEFDVLSDDWKLDVNAVFGFKKKEWACRVSVADCTYRISWRLIEGVSPASVEAATADNYQKMIADLRVLGKGNGVLWYAVEAVKAHEQAHLLEWRNCLDAQLPGVKRIIEELTASHACGKSPDAAATEIRGKSEFTDAVATAYENARSKYMSYGERNSLAAEWKVVNELIAAITEKAKKNHWPPYN